MNNQLPVLEIKQVSKLFGQVVAVDKVDLTVERGEVLTLLGPSGSGKTTILKMIAGFERQSQGMILLEGEDASSFTPAERRIGFVFQHHALFPHMTVGDNIRYPLKMKKWPKIEYAKKLSDVLNLVKLEGFEDRYPQQLSGGQRQRVALARALVFSPRFLLMDEPLGALDRALRFELAEELRRIHRLTGTTIIYVTHDQEEALTLSDRIAVMRRGKIVQVGSPKELYEHPVESFIAQFLGECNLLPVESWSLRSGGGVEVNLDGRKLTLLASRNLQKDHNAVIVVRPIHFLVNPANVDFCFSGYVTELLYMGEVIRIRFTYKGYDLLIRTDPSTLHNVSIGDEIMIGFNADKAVLVPQTEAPTIKEMERII